MSALARSRIVLILVLSIGTLVTTTATAVAEGGETVAWGENFSVELGAGYKSNNEEVPVDALGGLSNVVSVSSGEGWNLALLSDGTVRSWGGNVHGQLGDGSKEDIWEKQTGTSPIEPADLSYVQTMVMNKSTKTVTGPLSEVSAVSASGWHGLALLKNGTLMAWGTNEYGEDGQGELNPNERENPKTKEKESTMGGTSPHAAEPVEWQEGGETRKLENVVAIATGSNSSADYAVVKNPTTGITSLWAWGKNDDDQLGLGKSGESGPEECKSAELGIEDCSTKPRQVELPSSVTSGEKHIVAVGAGAEYAIALLDDGTALTWGKNNFGQLGRNTGKEDFSNQPVAVEGLTEATAIAAGAYHVLALRKSGAVVGWGRNDDGELGEESGQLGEAAAEECQKIVCRKLPTAVTWKDTKGTHELTDISAITAGFNYGLALHEGKILSFGGNKDGELGVGSSGSAERAEPCRNELEIKEKSGKLVNQLDNKARCKAPEECVSTTELTVSWKGAWSEATEYSYGEGVEEGASKYVSINEKNKKHKPSESPTWWAKVSESTGDKIREETGIPCASAPHQVEGIGSVAAISSGAKHAVAVLKAGVAAPAPLLTLTPGRESLTEKWLVQPRKVEYKVRAGRFNPEHPESPEWGKAITYTLEPAKEETLSQMFPGGSELAFKIEPYVVQLRSCWPECKMGVYPEKYRYVAGTPLPPPPTVTSVSPTSGPRAGGTTVTIHGTYLTGASEVRFGSVASKKVTVISAEEATAESPEASTTGTVNITVTTRGGTSATSEADQFTYD